ncbi:hypothetical protein MMC28_011213 [Mycoblastus sanguinarius]|nr:hypothetical protein [Mycoblastus sanguinarius]
MLKQDRVSELEEKLEQLDRDESRKLFLASTRRDANMARRQVLSEIDSALREYDRQVEQNHRMLNYRPAPKRAVANLNNWVQGTVPLAREETAYLQRETDLLCVNVPTDNALVQLEEMIESVFVRFHKAYHKQADARTQKSARLNISRDKHVWIWSGGLLGRTARGLAVCLISTLLVVPVVVVSAVDSILLRLCIIFVATSAFILALSGFTKARTAEMLVAGATYTTVLVVFVAGNGLGS